MENRYGDLKTLFFANALRETLPQATSALPYKGRLKAWVNNFLIMYNKEITPHLWNMYKMEGNDENFEVFADSVAAIAKELNETKPTDFPIIAGLIKAYNNGEIKIEHDEREQGVYDKV